MCCINFTPKTNFTKFLAWRNTKTEKESEDQGWCRIPDIQWQSAVQSHKRSYNFLLLLFIFSSLKQSLQHVHLKSSATWYKQYFPLGVKTNLTGYTWATTFDLLLLENVLTLQSWICKAQTEFLSQAGDTLSPRRVRSAGSYPQAYPHFKIFPAGLNCFFPKVSMLLDQTILNDIHRGAS